MKFIPKNEQEFRKQNPFEPVYDKHLTKAQKNETIAHFMYEIDNTVGKVTYGDIFNAFKTWSSDTIENGIKFYNKIKFDAILGAYND